MPFLPSRLQEEKPPLIPKPTKYPCYGSHLHLASSESLPPTVVSYVSLSLLKKIIYLLI